MCSQQIHHSNAILVIQYQNSKDNQAFGKLYQRYYPKVFQYCVAMLKDREVSFDITQDVFLTIAERLDELRTPATFVSWIFRITRNKCIDQLKARRRFLEACEEMNGEPVEDLSDLEWAREKERRLTGLEKSMTALEEPQRLLLEKKYLHGESILELEEEYGLSESAVKMRLARARGRLAQLMMADPGTGSEKNARVNFF